MHLVTLQVKAAEGEKAKKVRAPKKPKKANDLIEKVLPLDEFEKAVAELKPVLPNVVYIHATGVLAFAGFTNLFCPGPNCHKYCKSKGYCTGRDPCSPALPPGFSRETWKPAANSGSAPQHRVHPCTGCIEPQHAQLFCLPLEVAFLPMRPSMEPEERCR